MENLETLIIIIFYSSSLNFTKQYINKLYIPPPTAATANNPKEPAIIAPDDPPSSAPGSTFTGNGVVALEVVISAVFDGMTSGLVGASPAVVVISVVVGSGVVAVVVVVKIGSSVVFVVFVLFCFFRGFIYFLFKQKIV